jgi:hypothetical protein
MLPFVPSPALADITTKLPLHYRVTSKALQMIGS